MVSWSKFKEYVRISFESIKARKMRSWLTMVGIFIGIAAVIALSALGFGLQSYIDDQFASLGVNKLYIVPAGSIFGAGGVDSLSEDDYRVIRRVGGVEEVTGYMMSTAAVEWGDELWYHFIMGVSDKPVEQEILLSGQLEIEQGRMIRQGEKYVAVVGYDYTNSAAFSRHLGVGNKVFINGQEFKVIGTAKRIGNPTDDRAITIPIDTAREVLNVPTRLDSIVVEIKQGEEPQEVADRIEREMRRDRGLKEGSEDFAIQTVEDLMESFNAIVGIVIGTILMISMISLLVGGVGIMNTMYTAVLQRTQEIGVMKAIGARNSEILKLFLLESGILGLAGGIIGIIIGIILASGISWAAVNLGGFDALVARFPLWLILGSLVFSFVIGVASGVLPAQQAARKNPVDSLRYE